MKGKTMTDSVMWLATYTDPRSNTGKGISVCTTERMPDLVASYPDVVFSIYRREECDVFTPDVVSACMGTSPSI